MRDEPFFGCNHPVYAWAVLHACWTHNRFSVTHASTPFELCLGRMCTGKLARYGERVLGFLKTDMKGKPQGRLGICLGKTTQNDTHIIAVADGVFVTRSIRRLTSAFDVKYFTDLTTCPWECNYAALGHTMMHAKRVLAPVPVPSMIDANLAPPPMLTVSVPYTPDEAAFDPPTPGETKSSPAPTTPGVVTSCHSPSDSKSEDASQAGKVSSKARGEGSSEPITPSLQSSSSSATQAMDESTRPEHERPATEDSSKAPKQLRMNVISYADMHEDMEPDLSQDAFGEDVIDSLESYDFNVEDDDEWDYDYVDDENVAATSHEDDTKKFIYPYDKEEPQLTDEQMVELDGIADKIEIQRLLGMGVLLNASCLDGTAYKQVSTRFVRTWRDKEMVIDGKPTRAWVRRSRLFARELAWLCDDKQSTFSPASSSISSRVLPVIFLQHRDEDWILMSCDVQDAFLTVKQRDLTMIVAKDAVGNEQPYALGTVLPGQRARSQLWNEDITNHLKQTLDMVECENFPQAC